MTKSHLNDNNVMSENFCSNCRQSKKAKRIDRHYIIHEIEHVLHFERGILYTIKELLIRPGQSVRTFISDDRNRLVKPIIFIILSSLIYTLINNFFHIEAGYMYYSETSKTALSSIFNWIQNHYGYANIIMGVFIAFWLKLFFRKYDYNFFEILILLCFVIGMGMLLFSVFAFIEGLTKLKLMSISGAIFFIYCSCAIAHFFDKHKKINYLKAFFAYVLGSLTFVFSAIILGILIDIVIKH